MNTKGFTRFTRSWAPAPLHNPMFCGEFKKQNMKIFLKFIVVRQYIQELEEDNFEIILKIKFSKTTNIIDTKKRLNFTYFI